MSIKGTFKIVRGGRHPIKLGRNIGGHPAFSTLKKERDSTGSKKKDHWATCDTFRFYHKHKKVPLRVFKIAKKNGVFQNLLHLGIRKINKTQRKCQHQNKNCVSCCCCCCFWDYRPSVATFLLKLSLCFLSGPTVLWNLIWKHRLLPLSLLLFYYIMIVWPPMLNKKQVWRNANQDTRWWWAFLAYCKYRWEASDNCEMSRGAS